MVNRLLNVCSLGGPAALGVVGAGWLTAGMLPAPLGPSASPAEVVAYFTAEPNRVMVGYALASLGMALMAPMLALISLHMARMEGRIPVLAVTQLVTGTTTVLLNLLPMLLFAIAGFRVDRSPDTIILLNDVAWLVLFTAIVPFMLQNLSIGLAVIRDRSGVFPRWVGYLNFWVAFAFVPDVLAFFFKTGPFAWNGVLVFWLALVAYSVFLVAMSVTTWRANARVGAPAEAVPVVAQSR